MTKDQIIEAIKALSEVVKANSGMLGDEKVKDEANRKIKLLIIQL